MRDGDAAGSNRKLLDPKTSERRLLECAKCDAPVASSAWSGRVTLRCDYCAFEDERELTVVTLSAEAAEPYRGRSGAARSGGKRMELDLSRAYPGRALGAFGLAELRASCKREPLSPSALPDVEWERVWMATWLALLALKEGDPLTARVALERTLETTKTPAYRALLLAHLAQHAAHLGATKLAKKWLSAAPDLAIAEVSSEIAAAEAMIAWKKGRFDEVVERTGRFVPAQGFVGGAVALATCLNLAAHDRIGNVQNTDEAIGNAARRNLFTLTPFHQEAFQLHVARFAVLLRHGRLRAAAVTIGSVLVLVLASNAIGVHAPWPLAVVAGAVCAAAAAAFEWLTFLWRAGAQPGALRWFRANSHVLFVCLCLVGVVELLMQHQPPLPPTSSVTKGATQRVDESLPVLHLDPAPRPSASTVADPE